MTRKIFLIVLSSIFCILSFGQKIDDYYILKTTEGGTICYLNPMDMFKVSKGASQVTSPKGVSLEYDMTFSSFDKEIVMNFTYISSSSSEVDSVKFISGDKVLLSEPTKIYIELYKKDKWKQRYTLADEVEEFKKIHTSEVVPSIILYVEGEEIIFNPKPRKWKKYYPIGIRLFSLLDIYNK